jgi:histidinol dehydrogenase
MKLRRLSTRERSFEAKLKALTRYDAAQDPAVQKSVRKILADVRKRGDAAVRAYTKKFDGVSPRDFSLDKRLDAIPREQLDALRAAHERIRAFHERQLQKSWDFTDADGTRLGQQVSALERVGLYVPGGKAAYPSSVLMNAVPAKVAGVRELVMVSPNPNPLVLAAAALAGVDRVLGIGGAQAIGALAYGTKSIPRQDRRARQRLRRRGQAPGVRRGRHRHGRRPLRDPGDRRRQRAGRLGGDGSLLAGRARRVGSGDPAFAE